MGNGRRAEYRVLKRQSPIVGRRDDDLHVMPAIGAYPEYVSGNQSARGDWRGVVGYGRCLTRADGFKNARAVFAKVVQRGRALRREVRAVEKISPPERETAPVSRFKYVFGSRVAVPDGPANTQTGKAAAMKTSAVELLKRLDMRGIVTIRLRVNQVPELSLSDSAR